MSDRLHNIFNNSITKIIFPAYLHLGMDLLGCVMFIGINHFKDA